jgi:hypothetical protein
MSKRSTATIDRMLFNEKYAGTALLQKAFVADPLTHKKAKNRGELSMYHVANSHRAIVNPDVFETVQQKSMKKGIGELRRSYECLLAYLIKTPQKRTNI